MKERGPMVEESHKVNPQKRWSACPFPGILRK